MRIRVFRVPSAQASRHLARLSERSRILFDGEGAEVAGRALEEIRGGGDRALSRWRKKYDGDAGPLRAEAGRARPSAEFREAFECSFSRLTAFHSLQRNDGVRLRIAGSLIEERVLPLDSVGVYVPGGEAPYVSTALMTILPAKIAGVPRIVVATPPSSWDRSAELRWAVKRLGVAEVYRMGGAHAIAALALGTESVPRVAKIVGPGNRFVTAAKRLVSGLVGIDGLAGPTEVAVFADDSADAERVAADLLAQAEHDVSAAAMLVTTSSRLAGRVKEALGRRVKFLPTAERASRSLERYGAIAIAASVKDAVAYLEKFAPEHLGVQTRRSLEHARLFRRAGAVFAGEASSEVFGDYVAGTNHVLPTNATGRFASALSVRDFVRRMPVVSLSRRDGESRAAAAQVWARVEGLPAHGEAARLRARGAAR